MTLINPIPIYPPGFQPITPVTPFTYRDGLTYIELLNDLREYIKDVLVPWVSTSLTTEQDATAGILNDLIETFNETVAAMLNGSVVFSVPVLMEIFNQTDSTFREALDATYGAKTDVDSLKTLTTTGRLGQSSLDGAYGAKTDVDSLKTLTTTGRLGQSSLDGAYGAKTDVDSLKTLTTTGRLSDNSLKSQIASFVNVKRFGAVGDGVADDTAAINLAEAASNNNTLYFPAGDYRVTSTINKTTSKAWIGDTASYSQGVAQAKASRIIVDGISGYTLNITSVPNVLIKNLEFVTVNSSADVASGIYINGPAQGNSKIEDCSFQNFAVGIKIGSATNWIENNYFQSCGICIDISSSENHIICNHGYGDSNTGNGCAILCRSSANIIVGNKFFGDGAKTNYGLIIWGYGNTVNGNVFDAFLEAGIMLKANSIPPLTAANPACDSNTIVGNSIGGCGNYGNIASAGSAGTYNSAILVNALNSDVSNTIISGNTIYNKRSDRATDTAIYMIAAPGKSINSVLAYPNSISNVNNKFIKSGTIIGFDNNEKNTISVNPGEFNNVGGNPSQSSINGVWPVWLLDPNTNESISATIKIPDSWSTFDVFVETVNAGAGTGAYALRLIYSFKGDGEDLSTGFTTGSVITTVADSQNILKNVNVYSNISVVPEKYFVITVGRRADDSTDTLTNDIGISAFKLVKRS